jgi:hypothetical protein
MVTRTKARGDLYLGLSLVLATAAVVEEDEVEEAVVIY